MKELDVKKVSMANIPVEAVPALLDEEKVAFQPVNTVNWAAYPYCPDVKFRIAYTERTRSSGQRQRAGLGRCLCGVLFYSCRRRSIL